MFSKCINLFLFFCKTTVFFLPSPSRVFSRVRAESRVRVIFLGCWVRGESEFSNYDLCNINKALISSIHLCSQLYIFACNASKIVNFLHAYFLPGNLWEKYKKNYKPSSISISYQRLEMAGLLQNIIAKWVHHLICHVSLFLNRLPSTLHLIYK